MNCMNYLTRILSGSALVLVASATQAAAQGAYKVVVNSANPTQSLRTDELSRLFLKKVTTWKGGGTVTLVELLESSPVREDFTRAIHRRAVPAVKSYWQQQIFSGRGVPPTERATDAEVLALVAASPHALGYVAASTPLGPGVKELTIQK